jgi:hypothetical protein
MVVIDGACQREHKTIPSRYYQLLSFQLKCSSNIDSIHYLRLTNSFHQVPRDIHTLPVKDANFQVFDLFWSLPFYLWLVSCTNNKGDWCIQTIQQEVDNFTRKCMNISRNLIKWIGQPEVMYFEMGILKTGSPYYRGDPISRGEFKTSHINHCVSNCPLPFLTLVFLLVNIS